MSFLRDLANWVMGPQACVLAPLVVIPLLLLIPRRRPAWSNAAAVVGLVAQVGIVVLTAAGADWLRDGAVIRADSPTVWLAGAGSTLDLRLDGMNLLPVLLTPLLVLGALLASWRDTTLQGRARGLALLVVASAAVGALCAFDLIVMCFALQVATLGAAYLIGGVDSGAADNGPVNGGSGRRAAVRFAVYHLVGTTALLAVALALQIWLEGPATASIEGLSHAAVPASVQSALLAGSVLCFAALMGLPLAHGWLVQCAGAGARTGVLVIVGLWPLLGAHGLCRVSAGIFPAAVVTWSGVGATLAAGTALYGALIAAAQSDLMRRLAWVTIAMAGSVLLALCAGSREAAVGVVVLACAQAPVRLALAALAQGHVDAAAERRGLAGWWMAAALALVALPGSGAFAGAFLAAPAVAASWPLQGLTVLAALGLATGALVTPYRVLRARDATAGRALDLGVRLVVVAALALTLALGLRPGLAIEVIELPVSRIPMSQVGGEL